MPASMRSAAARADRFRRYLARENARPLLGFYTKSEYPLKRYPSAQRLPSGRALQPQDFDIHALACDAEALYAAHEALGGDFLYAASAFWGVPWLEALLGCSVYVNEASGALDARPPADCERLPAFSEGNAWAQLAAAMLKEHAAVSGGRYPLATTRVRGVSDALQMLFGGEGFLYRLMDEPEGTAAVCERVADTIAAFSLFQHRHIPPFFGGCGSFYYHMWGPPGTVWLQEDAAALLSPALYRQHIAPHVACVVQRAGPCVMHMHPTAYVPLEEYLRLPLLALELHVDVGGPSPLQLEARHRAILAHKPLLVWGRLCQEEIRDLFRRLPHAGLAVLTQVEGPQEARAIWDTVMEGYDEES